MAHLLKMGSRFRGNDGKKIKRNDGMEKITTDERSDLVTVGKANSTPCNNVGFNEQSVESGFIGQRLDEKLVSSINSPTGF